MSNFIGIRHEDKYELETRAPLTPKHVERLVKQKKLDIVVQTSEKRVFTDEEYSKAGVTSVTRNEIFSKSDLIISVNSLPDDDLKLLDQAAKLSLAGNGALEELSSLYLQDMRLRVPPVVKSWYVEDEEKYRLEEIFGRNLSLVKYL